MSRTRALLRAAERLGRVAEDAILVLILSAMMLLAAGQILLRNAFDIGFIWSDELLRLMVLWLAVAGAVAASRADRHINIAVLDRYFAGRVLTGIRIATYAFTASVCGAVAWFAGQFVLTSRLYGDVLLGGVPAWWLQAVLPAGFALMAWRYGIYVLKSVRQLLFRHDGP